MHGILPIWKERGMTSHDVVYKVRKILQTKKVGHTGTLDPEVDGVLPICIGQATKIASMITDSGKEYEATVTFGQATETEDKYGKVIEERQVEQPITAKEVERVLQQLEGELCQIPPMYSAVRVNGRRLYEYARLGMTVERPKRYVQIYEIERLDEEKSLEGPFPTLSFRVRCSKGTYIRTLAVQIGEALGYPAHMSSLTRVQSSSYRKEDCVTLKELEHFVKQGQLSDVLLPLETALQKYPFVEIEEEKEYLYRNGQVFEAHPLLDEYEEIVMSSKGKAIGIYHRHPTKPDRMKPVKMFPQNE